MEFKIGDEVRVINNGKCYPAFDNFMEMYGTKKNCMHFKTGELVDNGFIGKISVIAVNEKTLAIVDDGVHSYIMGLSGIELIKSEADIKNKFDKLKKKRIFLPMVDYSNECDIILVKLENIDDYHSLVEYYELINKNSGTSYLKDYEKLKFPCVKAVYNSDTFTDFCYDGHNQTDIEILIDGLSKAITDINNF